MSSEQFSLYWDNFHKNISMGMQSLLETKDLVDVTLAVEGRYLKAHKMVLSVCSPYFRELFQSNPCKHPIVFMKDVSYVALNDLLHFMYLGEAQVAQENFSTFMQTAEALQITGLTGDGAAQMTCEGGQLSEKNTVETSAKRSNDAIDQNTNNTTQSITSIPASKRQKCSNVPTPSKTPSPVPSTVKYEFTSDNLQSDLDIKVEHDDNIQETEEHDGNQEECINESVLFKMNEDADFLLMESGSDDPRPTTSTDPGDDQGSYIQRMNVQRDVLKNSGNNWNRQGTTVDGKLNFLIDKVEDLLQRTFTTESDGDKPSVLDSVLPFKTIEEITAFDRRIGQSKEIRSELKKVILKTGGRTAQEHIVNVCKKMFTNEVGLKCSWLGRKNNFAIYKLKCIIMFRGIILTRYSNITERIFSGIVANWFRFSRQRFERSLHKNQQRKNQKNPGNRNEDDIGIVVDQFDSNNTTMSRIEKLKKYIDF